jgi:alpha-glucosidase
MEGWWRYAVVYQIYPRSFQDSDGDGIGDLGGVVARLDHLAWLGVDALWLSPIYPSPGVDLGYDITDHTAVASELGTLEDLDRLVAAAHARGIRVLLDLVPNHTSIEHRWFREHPDWYVWAEDGPPNNWLATFGGPAWSRDDASGRWYLHSFYPEQPDLDWSAPEVHDAFAEVIRFWLSRGVDGFRVDAVDRLVKDPELRDDPPASEPFPLPLPQDYARLEHRYSVDATDASVVLSALREAAREAALIGEVYLPTARLHHYLEHLDLAFAFEFLHAPPQAERLSEAISASSALDSVAWVLGNHDFPRPASRFGERLAPAAALILLTLPGAAFVYQGDEIGMTNGPGAHPPIDRAGRDSFRHPMQWDASSSGGFTSGDAWLPPIDPERRNVADQRDREGSMLRLHRELIALRRELGPGIGAIEAEGDVLAYRRGAHLVAVNLGSRTRPAPGDGEVLLTTLPNRHRPGLLAPGEGTVAAIA